MNHLDAIAKWNIFEFDELMKYVEQVWEHREIHLTPGNASLSTGGSRWNEKIIEVLQMRNHGAWWKLCCDEAKRGGHYKFSLAFRYESAMDTRWQESQASDTGGKEEKTQQELLDSTVS